MKLVLESPYFVLSDVVVQCNKVLQQQSALCELFVPLIRAFCDDEESARLVTGESAIATLLQPDRIVTIARKVPKVEDAFTMMASAADNVIFVNRNELPDEDAFRGDPERVAKSHLFLFISLMHEIFHLFTKDFNEIAKNSNSLQETTKRETPEKIGRATFDGITNKDAGTGFEAILFGGIVFFEDGILSVNVIANTEIDVCAKGNTTIYEVSGELSLSIVEQIRSWYLSPEDVSIVSILSQLHCSHLPLREGQTAEDTAAVIHGMRTKYHTKYHSTQSQSKTNWLRRNVKKRLFPSGLSPGEKA